MNDQRQVGRERSVALEPEQPSAVREGNGRVQRSRARVLDTTLEVLTEHGVGGVSVDEVARRSGVAKTTIYRHWPTRADLVLDACAQLSSDQDVPDTGSVQGDITTHLINIAGLLRTARWSSVMPSIIDAAERDPALAQIHSRIQAGHAAPLQAIIARAACTGQLPSDADPSALIAALLGPLYYRRWFSREPIDDAFVSGLVKTVIGQG